MAIEWQWKVATTISLSVAGRALTVLVSLSQPISTRNNCDADARDQRTRRVTNWVDLFRSVRALRASPVQSVCRCAARAGWVTSSPATTVMGERAMRCNAAGRPAGQRTLFIVDWFSSVQLTQLLPRPSISRATHSKLVSPALRHRPTPRPSSHVHYNIHRVHDSDVVLFHIYASWFLPPCCSWLGSRVVSVLDSAAEGPGFKSQSRRCRVTVLGKLFTPIVPLFTKQQNW